MIHKRSSDVNDDSMCTSVFNSEQKTKNQKHGNKTGCKRARRKDEAKKCKKRADPDSNYGQPTTGYYAEYSITIGMLVLYLQCKYVFLCGKNFGFIKLP